MLLAGLAVDGTRLVCSVLASSPPPVLYTFAIEGAADYVVADTRQVFYPATAYQDYRVLLEVMTFTADISGNFDSVGEAHPRDFTQRGVGLFRCHCSYLNAHAPPLRTPATPLDPVL